MAAVDRDKRMQEAQSLIEKNKFDKGLAIYNELLASQPGDDRLLLKMAQLQVTMRLPAEAAVTYERLGDTLAKKGFAQRAAFAYGQARDVLRKLANPKGIALLLHKLAGAQEDAKLGRDALETLSSLVDILQAEQRDEEAVEAINRALKIEPLDPMLHARASASYFRLGDDAAGVEALTSTVEAFLARNDYASALHGLDQLYARTGDVHYARSAGEVLLRMGRAAEALQKLQVAHREQTRDAGILALIAEAFRAMGQASKAALVEQEIAAIEANMPSEGAMSVASAHIEAAAQVLSGVHSLDPLTRDMGLEDGLEYADNVAEAGDFELARTLLAELLVRFPSHPLLLDKLDEVNDLETEAYGGGARSAHPSPGNG